MNLTTETGRPGAAAVRIAGTPLWQKALATTTLVIGVLCLPLMLLAAGHGIDMTDTGFYLNALAHPSEYWATGSEFAHLWSPLFRFVGEDIGVARQAGICIVFALSTLLSCLLIRLSGLRARAASGEPSLHWQIALSVGSSTTGFLVFYQMLMDLNYNILNLIGIQLTLIGALLGVLGPRNQRRGWVLSGASLGLLALNKPTTSVLTAVIVAGVVALLGRLSWRTAALVCLSGAVSMGAFVFVIFGSAQGYLEALATARTHFSALTGDDLAYIWRVFFSAPTIVELIPVAAVVAAVLVPPAARALLGWTLVAAGVVLVVRAPSYLVDSGIPIQVRPWTLVMIPAFLIAWRIVDPFLPANRRHESNVAGIFIGLALSLLPLAWAWGTYDSLIDHAGLAAYFWAIASIWLVPDSRPDVRLAVVAITQLVAVGILLSWMWGPYRQQEPLFRQDVPALVGPAQSEIRLSGSSARYFRELAERTAADEPPVGAPLIDLTGDSPMTAFGLGARPLGMPWLLGGYPGSDQAAAFALSLADCTDLATAWVVTSDGGPRALGGTVLDNLGLEFPERYAKVWSISEVPWSGAPPLTTPVEHTLWKPRMPLEPTDCRSG